MRARFATLLFSALLTLSAPQASAYEVLVEVSGNDGSSRVIGPYVYRTLEYFEQANGGSASADFRDGRLRADLVAGAGRRAGAFALTADFITVNVPPGYPAPTIDVGWRVELTVTTDLTTLPETLGLFRFRLLSASGSIDESFRFENLFDGTLSGDGHYTVTGTLSLPAADVILSPYSILVAELGDEEAGTLVVDARATLDVPAGLELDIEGCSLLDYQAAFDSDADGFADDADTCKLMANPEQVDADGDGVGNRCDADFDNDGESTPLDLGILRSRFFTADPVADMDASGRVAFTDLGLFRLGYLQTPGPSCALPAGP